MPPLQRACREAVASPALQGWEKEAEGVEARFNGLATGCLQPQAARG